MKVIDGSFGESGGQILRTALALATLTNTPVRIINIRQKRKVSGLSEQHVQVIKAMQQLCSADVTGNSLRSSEVIFIPKEVSKSKNISVTISTAGSVGLVFQSLMIAGVIDDFSISVFGGGTYGEWAPPVEHIKNVLIPLLKKFGYVGDIVVEKEGFFPKGGAFVRLQTKKSVLTPIILKIPVKNSEVFGISIATNSLKEKNVAERQKESALQELRDFKKVSIEEKYVNALSPGSALQVWCIGADSIVGANCLGALRRSSSEVGIMAAKRLVSACNFAVDVHTADQLIPFMGISGSGELFVEEVSDHARTNAWVVEQFLPVKFSFEDHLIRCKKLE